MQQSLELQYAGKINGINSTSRVNDFLYFGGSGPTIAYILMAPETTTITELGWPWLQQEGSPGEFRYELRNVTSTGSYGNTYYAVTGYKGPGDLTFNTSTTGVCSVFEVLTPYEVQAGQYYAICCTQTGGTWNSSNRLYQIKYTIILRKWCGC
jgi:hypothetical protein